MHGHTRSGSAHSAAPCGKARYRCHSWPLASCGGVRRQRRGDAGGAPCGQCGREETGDDKLRAGFEAAQVECGQRAAAAAREAAAAAKSAGGERGSDGRVVAARAGSENGAGVQRPAGRQRARDKHEIEARSLVDRGRAAAQLRVPARERARGARVVGAKGVHEGRRGEGVGGNRDQVPAYVATAAVGAVRTEGRCEPAGVCAGAGAGAGPISEQSQARAGCAAKAAGERPPQPQA